VRDIASLTRPRAVHWCDGSVAEYESLCQKLVETGTLERLSGVK
jgi:phosphoenolpyruvate carboxykinase (GTP)